MLKRQAGFPWWLMVENPPANVGDAGSIPGLERFPRGGKWLPTPVFLPGESHGQRGPGLQSMGLQGFGHDSIHKDIGMLVTCVHL